MCIGRNKTELKRLVYILCNIVNRKFPPGLGLEGKLSNQFKLMYLHKWMLKALTSNTLTDHEVRIQTTNITKCLVSSHLVNTSANEKDQLNFFIYFKSLT